MEVTLQKCNTDKSNFSEPYVIAPNDEVAEIYQPLNFEVVEYSHQWWPWACGWTPPRWWWAPTPPPAGPSASSSAPGIAMGIDVYIKENISHMMHSDVNCYTVLSLYRHFSESRAICSLL